MIFLLDSEIHLICMVAGTDAWMAGVPGFFDGRAVAGDVTAPSVRLMSSRENVSTSELYFSVHALMFLL